MSINHETVSGAVDSAAQTLAAELVEAISGTADGFSLHRKIAQQTEPVPALAAIRVLGADVLSAYLLADHAFADADAELVHAAVGAFPAPPGTAPDGALWALRDRALTTALAELGVAADGWPGLAGTTVEPPEAAHWAAWSGELVRCSSLALPPVASPLREQARRRRLDLVRGVSRALLRRDYPSAAKLTRWLALDERQVPEPLLAPALEQLEHLAAGQPRTMLDVTLARRFSRGES
ncbi:hypothetical protein E6W39_35160 [Kitasatospora acidiphila]|uniref:Uncharacterized protein n=1 Tax=Kitasatospora acidiphila TaxID=2567942 RepID=A0A540WBQ4_9ACTN|nr:hypothetical protein [Kitasatospora acidiphila]TQF06479.1 hypothetical protein E6W39_35160 [Kitasatospora acidiphila]